MVRSMTAFARKDVQGEWGSAAWELRSVNFRYLDVSLRLPEEFRPLEATVRERVQARLGRGRVECTLRFQGSAPGSEGLNLDLELAGQLVQACRRIDALLDTPAAVQPLDVLRWPGVVIPVVPDVESAGAAVLELLGEVLEDLVGGREREGAQISHMLRVRSSEISAITAHVRTRMPEVIEAARERLRSRVAEAGVDVDEGRLEQEIALLAQKLDVAEELDRLDAHVQEVRRVLDEDVPVGRRLDFLMQEMNREANTLGSKSADAEVSRAGVDLKVLIEQMREQIQNVE